VRLSVAFVCWFALAYAVRAADLPVPVVQFTFSSATANEGVGGGEAEIITHAAGEEPVAIPGTSLKGKVKTNSPWAPETF